MILATAGVVVGLAVGIIGVALLTGSGGGGEAQPYQPFFVGTSDRVAKRIQSEGPECYQDPKKGDRSFCVDLDATAKSGDTPEPPGFIALHVVPPGGTKACLVQWDRKEKRYEDCHGTPVDRDALARFPVLTREISGKISVFVDVRETSAPGGS